MGSVNDRLPLNSAKTLEVPCKIVEGYDGENYYAPENPDALKNFLATNFVIEVNDGQEEFEQFFGFVVDPCGETPAVETPEIPSAYGKDDEWIVYWYACGTDIETTRIAFGAGTDLASNKIIIGDERCPGDITRSIREIEKADLSSGKVKVFMQAGGTYIWGHEKFQELNATISQIREATPDEITAAVAQGIYPHTRRPSPFNGNVAGWTFNKPFYKNRITLSSNGKIGRYVYSKDEHDWQPRQILPINANDRSTDMGTEAGLVSFLQYGKNLEAELFPGKNIHRVFIFRDHGGGFFEVCWDEYTDNALNLKTIRNAFTKVFKNEISQNNPPFEIVAFDACLMSSYEMAANLEGIAHYMIGSQMPTIGKVSYDYTGFLTALSKNPSMDRKTLGKIICNTYNEDSKRTDREFSDWNLNTQESITISVTDISKIPAVTAAYENFAKMSLNYAKNHPEESIAVFGTVANSAENYDKDCGLVDLKNFAELTKTTRGLANDQNLSAASDTLIAAINNAVVYNEVRANALKRGGGLSTFYPYNFAAIPRYNDIESAPNSQKEFYNFLGELLPKSGSNYSVNVANSQNNSDALNPARQAGINFDLSELNETYVDVDKVEKTVSVDLTKSKMNKIAGVRGQVIFSKMVDDNLKMIFWGNYTDVEADWDIGEFKSKFNGDWLMINNQPVYVKVIAEAPIVYGKKVGSELYAIPIILNDEASTMTVVCEYPSKKFKIVDVRPEYNDNIAIDELRGIKKGDVIKPLYMAMSIPKNILENEAVAENFSEEMKKFVEEYKQLEEKLKRGEQVNQRILEQMRLKIARLNIEFYAGDPITIGNKISIKNSPLPDGNYFYAFEFVNPVGGNNAFSEFNAVYTIEKGKVTDLRDSDDIETPEDL